MRLSGLEGPVPPGAAGPSGSLRLAALAAAGLLLGSCASSPPPDERLHSALWVQTSAEYAVSTRQVYRMATDGLDAGLADPAWSALEGSVPASDLPPAIIVDVDETVLDNSGHTGRAIRAREGFTRDSWRAWMREASAPPVPGAVDFLREASARGITVFYVTNRHHDFESYTRENLLAVGCPIASEPDVVLTRLEDPSWGRDKSNRREYVGSRYRVLLVVGDDLADFIRIPQGVDEEARRRLAEETGDRWGRFWFLLPNPMYGSWEQALMPGGVSLFSRPMEEKFRQLDTR